ncbi:MAG: hypothetical protein OXJ52_10225 [Oligoflexia bacterium]|nr:hypothetical protein [Oligoflexia bacterium]
MKLPVSQLTSQDLADLFEKSSLKEQNFFPRKVPCLFSLETKDFQSKKQDKKSNQNEKPVEKD